MFPICPKYSYQVGQNQKKYKVKCALSACLHTHTHTKSEKSQKWCWFKHCWKYFQIVPDGHIRLIFAHFQTKTGVKIVRGKTTPTLLWIFILRWSQLKLLQEMSIFIFIYFSYFETPKGAMTTRTYPIVNILSNILPYTTFHYPI